MRWCCRRTTRRTLATLPRRRPHRHRLPAQDRARSAPSARTATWCPCAETWTPGWPSSTGAECEALVLAAAGLGRLGLLDRASELLERTAWLPAAGQGALAVVVRRDDRRARRLAASLDDHPTRQAVRAERELLRLLGAGCHLPVGVLGLPYPGGLRLWAMVLSPDGRRVIRADRTGRQTEPERLAVSRWRRSFWAAARVTCWRSFGALRPPPPTCDARPRSPDPQGARRRRASPPATAVPAPAASCSPTGASTFCTAAMWSTWPPRAPWGTRSWWDSTPTLPSLASRGRTAPTLPSRTAPPCSLLSPAST